MPQSTSADPAQGDTIKTPYSLSATFDDELTPDGASIVIVDANGTTVASGTVSATDDHTMTAELPLLPDGDYEVKWTAVSADDKAVERGTVPVPGQRVGVCEPRPLSAPPVRRRPLRRRPRANARAVRDEWLRHRRWQ